MSVKTALCLMAFLLVVSIANVRAESMEPQAGSEQSIPESEYDYYPDYPEDYTPDSTETTVTDVTAIPPTYRGQTTTTSIQTDASQSGKYRIVGNLTRPTLTINLPQVPGRHRPDEIAMLRNVTWSEALSTSSTMRPTCGGNAQYCMIEYDTTGDNKPECCTKENNPACNECYDFCKESCGRQYVGVKSCFSASKGPVCQCSQVAPTCYVLPEPPATTIPTANQAPSGTSTLFYVLLAGLIIVLAAAAVKFAHRIS
jgi:hypothetical protein